MTISDKKKWELCLILPPIFSLLFSLNDFIKNRGKASLYRFLFCSVAIISYWYVSYDTILKFWGIHAMSFFSRSNWLEGDPLSNIAGLCSPLLDYYYFMFIYWLLSGYFFYTSIYSHYQNKLSVVGVLLIIFGLNLTNWANLTYFTLSCTFAIFIGERIKNHLILVLPAIFIVYLLHPGMLLCFAPSILLFYLWEKGALKLSFLYLLAYAYASYLFFNTEISLYFLGDSDIASEHIRAYEGYTGDGKWGSEGLEYGIRGVIWYYSLYLILAIGLFFIYKHFTLLRSKFVSAIFVIAVITLYNSHRFYTFSERMGIVALLSCIVVFSILDSQNMLNQRMKKIIVPLVVVSFFSSVFMFVQPRRDMFINNEDGYEVSFRSFVVPTALCIFDLHHIGYSDSYLLQNGRNRHK